MRGSAGPVQGLITAPVPSALSTFVRVPLILARKPMEQASEEIGLIILKSLG